MMLVRLLGSYKILLGKIIWNDGELCLGNYRRLAKILKTPPMFADVLPLIVKPSEVELLLRICEKETSIAELSRLLGL